MLPWQHIDIVEMAIYGDLCMSAQIWICLNMVVRWWLGGCHNCQHTSLTADMAKYGDPVVQSNRSGRYAHIWSCTFGYKTTAHNNNIYGDSPSAAMPKYGVCCLTSYMATNEACPNMGNGHSGRICCSGQLGLHIWAYSICSQTGVLTIVTSQCWVWAPN